MNRRKICASRNKRKPSLEGLPLLKNSMPDFFQFTTFGAPYGKEFRPLRRAIKGTKSLWEPYTNLCFDCKQNITKSTVKTELHHKH